MGALLPHAFRSAKTASGRRSNCHPRQQGQPVAQPPGLSLEALHPGNFTLAAATDIVGLLLNARDCTQVAMACWGIAFLAWSALLYLAFSALTFVSHEHSEQMRARMTPH